MSAYGRKAMKVTIMDWERLFGLFFWQMGQYILKAAMGIEAFLQKATGGKVALSDITVENGRIKGLDAPLDKLLNDPGQNQTYLDYRVDILAIKNYEKMNGNSLLGGFSARYAVDGETIRTVSV